MMPHLYEIRNSVFIFDSKWVWYKTGYPFHWPYNQVISPNIAFWLFNTRYCDIYLPAKRIGITQKNGLIIALNFFNQFLTSRKKWIMYGWFSFRAARDIIEFKLHWPIGSFKVYALHTAVIKQITLIYALAYKSSHGIYTRCSFAVLNWFCISQFYPRHTSCKYIYWYILYHILTNTDLISAIQNPALRHSIIDSLVHKR